MQAPATFTPALRLLVRVALEAFQDVVRLAAAIDRTPLRQSISAFLPGGTAKRNLSSNAAFITIPGHCFHASGTASGMKPTHSRSASVRTSTSTASPDFHHL